MKIITAEGSDPIKIGFFRAKLDRGVDDDSKDIDGEIIQITKNVTDSCSKITIEKNKTELAVLLSEDVNIRVKADTSGVPTISTNTLKNYLLKHRSNGRKR